MPSSETITIVLPASLRGGAGAVQWAAEDLVEALKQRDIAARIAEKASGGPVIEIAGAGVAPGFAVHTDLPKVAEGMALLRDGSSILAWGHDERGIVYALTELADRARTVRGEDPFAGTFPLIE